MVVYPEKFNEAFKSVIGHEGGYVYDPNDKGGETKFGISKRAYPDIVIHKLTIEEAKEIYFRDYWIRYKADILPREINGLFFDMCVNFGGRGATRVLQETANSKNSYEIDVDGLIGNQTIKASIDIEPERLKAFRILKFAKIVISDKTQMKYWYGWYRRGTA